MIALPERKRRVNETSIVRKALVALNRIPGVRATRNNVGRSPCACGQCAPRLCQRCRARLTRPISFGLGVGSPDVVGIYTLRLPSGGVIAIPFGLEFKRPGARTEKKHAADQAAWMRVAEARGFLCRQVTSEREAMLAVGWMIEQWEISLSLHDSRSSTAQP